MKTFEECSEKQLFPCKAKGFARPRKPKWFARSFSWKEKAKRLAKKKENSFAENSHILMHYYKKKTCCPNASVQEHGTHYFVGFGPRSESGQGMAFDFVFAAFIFLIAWFYISDKLDFGFAEHENERSVGIMELKANLAADALVKGPGSPRDWENKWKTLGVGSVEMFGLAESDRVFSEAKLSAFSSISSDYPTVKEKLGLDNYDFSFSFTGVDDVNAGLEPMGPTTKLVAVQRAVTYKDQPGLATIKVYVLEG